jgi:hypothetical protein
MKRPTIPWWKEHEAQLQGNHLRVWRRDGKPSRLPWDAFQQIKNEMVGEDATAVEVFPPADQVVAEANMRHFWLVPYELLESVGACLRRC